MVCTLYSVKLVSKRFDGTSKTAPDSAFDSDSGFYVGYRLLVTDGLSYICLDAAVGAAIWDTDTSDDQMITDNCRAMTDRIVEYTDDRFIPPYGRYSSGGISFGASGEMKDEGDGFGDFYPGDTIDICGSRRNDGYYDVTSVTPGTMIVIPEFELEAADESVVYLYASKFPPALSIIASRMASYDIYDRDLRGLTSESIGTYSYSKETFEVAGQGYPVEVVSGLMTYKRPKVR